VDEVRHAARKAAAARAASARVGQAAAAARAGDGAMRAALRAKGGHRRRAWREEAAGSGRSGSRPGCIKRAWRGAPANILIDC
jgi:hypothetical protein